MTQRVLHVLTEEEADEALAKAAAEKIAAMSQEEAQEVLDEVETPEPDDPAKIAADDQARGALAFHACAEITKAAAQLIEEGHSHAEAIDILQDGADKYAAETEEIADDPAAIALEERIQHLAETDPDALERLVAEAEAAANGGGEGGEEPGAGGEE